MIVRKKITMCDHEEDKKKDTLPKGCRGLPQGIPRNKCELTRDFIIH